MSDDLGVEGGQVPPATSDDVKALYEGFHIGLDGVVPPLDPELAECLAEGSIMGPMLNHPLVHQAYLPMQNGLFNYILETKRERVAELSAERNWFALLFVMIERPYRVEWFQKYMDQMTDVEYWEILADLWMDTENLWQSHRAWQRLMTSDRPGREHLMSSDERQAFEELPEEFKIYRGTSAPDARGCGLAWTLDKERAVWFARRFVFDALVPRLITGKVNKEKVLAYFTRRSEQEIVVPIEDVCVLTTQGLRKRS